jgi:crotonobetainyl-CoA:carnitine CoA-transferase CaiB-like acyl-CoA transferase
MSSFLHFFLPSLLRRHEINNQLSRGKRVVEIDLKTTKGRSQANALLDDCDVLIENFSPGVMQRLG